MARKVSRTYQLKITLRDIRPPIWRRVQVPGSITLGDLHSVIQTAMSWTDTHLHEFEVDGQHFGVPDPGFDWPGEVTDEESVRLAEVMGVGGRARYTYDFGDNWEHVVVVEKILSPEPGVRLPRCLTGRRSTPPEDVGGPWRYADFLEAWTDPTHVEHEVWRDWGGPNFAPDSFSATDVSEWLQELSLR